MGKPEEMEKGKTKVDDEFSLDAVISELGPYGRFQMLVTFIVVLPILCSALYTSNYVFTAADMDYRCQVPQCESNPPRLTPGDWASFTLPSNAKDQRCSKKEPVGKECKAESFTNKTIKCDAWVYENEDTIVQAYDLGCQDWKRTLVGSINSAGIFLALPYTSYLSDTYGRKLAFIVTAFSNGFVGLVRSFSVNYYMHICLEFLNSVLGSGVYSAGYILALEMVGTNKRVLGGNILSSTFAMGQVTLAATAWAVPYWRTLMRVLYAPSLLFLLYYFILDESVRWLIVKQKKQKVIKIIKKAARRNKVTFSEGVQKMIEKYETEPAISTEHQNEANKQNSLRAVLRSKKLMVRVVICSFWWITVTFVYYGLSINSVSLAGNKYLNYILISLMEIPGYAFSWFALDVIGRKLTMMIAFFICGSGMLILPWIPATMAGFSTCIMLLSKMMISGAFSSIYVYTCELFPTCARHRLLGTCSMFARVGGMLAPMTPLLMVYFESLPYLLFGVFSFVASALMLLTPETLNKTLPDTIHQAENIADQRDDPHATKNTGFLKRLSEATKKTPSTKTNEDNTKSVSSPANQK